MASRSPDKLEFWNSLEQCLAMVEKRGQTLDEIDFIVEGIRHSIGYILSRALPWEDVKAVEQLGQRVRSLVILPQESGPSKEIRTCECAKAEFLF